jgi:hypothetical protein
MPLIVQGNVQAVQIYDVTNVTNVGQTKKTLLSTRSGRVSGYVKNTATSGTIYLKKDSTVSSTTYDVALAVNGTYYLESAYQGEIWGIATAGGTSVTTNEVYK